MNRRWILGALAVALPAVAAAQLDSLKALLGDPPVLLLDEPTAGLDARQTHELRALLRRLAEAHTILFSSHILSEVVELCARVLVVRDGALVLDEKMADLEAALGASRGGLEALILERAGRAGGEAR